MFAYILQITQTGVIMQVKSKNSFNFHSPKKLVEESFEYSHHITERVLLIAQYIIDHKATVRATAFQFSISKSTVHKDVTERLPNINSALAREVKKILQINKEERHIRGGMATRKKYLAEK